MLAAFMDAMKDAAGDVDASPETPPADAPGFEAFFETEYPRLARAMYLVTGNAQEAEEVAQDSFLAVWERWDRVSAMDDPTGYVYRTAMNRFRSRLRRAARAARRIVGTAEGRDAFADVDERDAVARALAALTPRQRAAVVLTESLASQGRAAMRAMLEPDDG
jgi:RNA polymerase sigma factor (sigma-70 family)